MHSLFFRMNTTLPRLCIIHKVEILLSNVTRVLFYLIRLLILNSFYSASLVLINACTYLKSVKRIKSIIAFLDKITFKIISSICFLTIRDVSFHTIKIFLQRMCDGIIVEVGSNQDRRYLGVCRICGHGARYIYREFAAIQVALLKYAPCCPNHRYPTPR